PPPPANPLPWEDPAYPRLEALYETAKLVLLYPRQAFSRMSTTVSLVKPILFAVIMGWVGILVGQIYQWAFRSTLASLMPWMFQRQDFIFSTITSVIVVITAPVWVLLGLGLATLVLHLFLLLYGGARGGLEVSLRTLAYTSATHLFHIIPVLGGLVGWLWWVVVASLGLAEAHQTSAGKAFAAVLTPLVLCCVCMLVVVFLAGAAIFGAFQSLR
ncbi:MAG: YIP1 family protein, partial [Thermoanaerobaculum sp.]